ncbi:MAG TPA: pyruvate formate lyase family protein, partial [Clostridia bacterium]|nr:pyruvate formate lyase family protein [Clostridia bacterium]
MGDRGFENQKTSARIRRLRHNSVTTQPRICMERARIETEVYREYEGKLSIPELRAMVLYRYMQDRTLSLDEDELIVGEKASGPQAAPTFPELCCHTPEDLRIMNDRPLISFAVSEADRSLQQEEIAPYWAGRSMREKLLASMSPEWKACYGAGIFTEFMEQRGPGHTVGSDMIYQKGFLEHREAIDEAIGRLDFAGDSRALEKLEELRAMRLSCEAILILGARYAALARERAREAEEPRRSELLAIAANCDVVPAHRPQTFWQALQMYWFVHLCVTTELNPWDAYSPGRLDQHLNP